MTFITDWFIHFKLCGIDVYWGAFRFPASTSHSQVATVLSGPCWFPALGRPGRVPWEIWLETDTGQWFRRFLTRLRWRKELPQSTERWLLHSGWAETWSHCLQLNREMTRWTNSCLKTTTDCSKSGWMTGSSQRWLVNCLEAAAKDGACSVAFWTTSFPHRKSPEYVSLFAKSLTGPLWNNRLFH